MNYEPNPLNEYDNYGYTLSLSMCHPSDSQLIAENGIGNRQVIPIIENVSDSRYNISGLEFISYTGYYPAGNQIQGKFNFSVQEQNGVTLLTLIKKAAQRLRISNHTLAHYILQIKFVGRETDGAPKTYPDVFTYPILFTRFTFNVTEQGTTYSIEAVEHTSVGYQYTNNVLRETTTVVAETIGEFIDEFELRYAAAQDQELRMNPNAVSYDTIKFEFIDSATEWRNWRFEELDNPDTRTGNNVVDGKMQIPLINGSQITTVLNNVLAMTSEYKQIQTDSAATYRSNGSDQPSTGSLSDFPVFFKIIPHITYGMYDPLRQEFQKEITFNIKPFITADLVVDATAYDAGISDAGIQNSRVQKLASSGLMRKRYDYLYTGKNTEVLGLDLNFDMIYYNVTALGSGQLGDANVVAPHTRRDGTATVSRLRDARQALFEEQDRRDSTQRDVASAKEQRSKIGNSINSMSDPRISVLGNLTNTINKGLSDLDNIFGFMDAQLTFDSALREYTELDSQQANDIPHRLRFQADVINGADHGGNESNTKGGTFQFGAVRQTLENPADLLRIELNVRGDPYWLGHSKSILTADGSSIADYTKGGHHIYLHCNLPVADEDASGLRPPRPDYQITAVYKVLNIISKFQDGQFVQYLDCNLDTATNPVAAASSLNSSAATESSGLNQRNIAVDSAGSQEAATASITIGPR
jgi:hypothetical protein